MQYMETLKNTENTKNIKNIKNIEYNIDNAWDNFLEEGSFDNINTQSIIELDKTDIVPKGTDIYISTKTTIAYLSTPIDLFNVFWKININAYYIPKEGIIKKQMKFNFLEKESLLSVEEKLHNVNNVEQNIITQIINPDGRIKFRDIRKISIGLCNKDIISYRSKRKSAFYNCFVIILRVMWDNRFREIHIKVFNTGKLEIPGIRCNKLLIKVMDLLVEILKPLVSDESITYDINNCETVLINSNFNCGFYINRDKLLDILKYKYKINCIFDSCQYPGIQCKYHYTDDSGKDYKISFMIFRTGSVLIVGKCEEDILIKVYNFIKELLITEYPNIYVINNESTKEISQKKKIKKKYIEVTNN